MLVNMSLFAFISTYNMSQKEHLIQIKPTGGKPRIPTFSPEYMSNPELHDYWKYCYYALWRYKPFQFYPEKTFDGADGECAVMESVTDREPQLLTRGMHLGMIQLETTNKEPTMQCEEK